MAEVCPKCGLPKELCACQAIDKEKQNIRIYTEEKSFKKKMTVIEGIDSDQIDLKGLSKKLKTKLACGGTIKDGKLELQGDHKKRAKELLKEEGFPENIIQVQ